MTKKNESIMFKIAQKILKHEDTFLAGEKKIKELSISAKEEAIKLKEEAPGKIQKEYKKMKKGIKLANDHRRTFLTEEKKPKRKRKKAKAKVKAKETKS